MLFLIAALVWLLLYLFVWRYRETTDDAYVAGDQVIVAPLVGGTVVAVLADDTDRVAAGQVVARLDDADARVALADAEGALAQAVRETQQRIESAATADAAIAQREAEEARASAEYARRAPLIAAHAGAQEEVANARAQMRAARAALEQARRQAAAAHALVDGVDVVHAPAVQQARARYADAWLALARTVVVAPVDGYAMQRQMQVGQTVQAGQRLLVVVPLDRVWVDANFKEVQLEHVRLGQPVELTADLYGGDVVYHGHVQGLSAGTGASSALLPPQNASGNWIKIVQRVPVRVALDPGELHRYPLRIGLSIYAKIDTHERDGAVLAAAPRDAAIASTAVYGEQVRDADAAADAVIARHLAAAPPAPR
ncbi:MAG TPA: HlyD family efflux transporter periplasmic adaptor subunit [Dokdonella sp.]